MEDTIIALLNNNLRVIIPDFGAFIIRQKQPRIIVFNEFLRYNDGILIDFIVKTEGIHREIAEQRVADFAEDGTKLLASGRELVIEGLGSLKKDSSGKISFFETPEIIEIENNDEIEPAKIPVAAGEPSMPEPIKQEISEKQQVVEEKIPVKPKPKSKSKVKPKGKSKIVPLKGKSPRTIKPSIKSVPPVIPLQYSEPVSVESSPAFEIAAVEPETTGKSRIESWAAFESAPTDPLATMEEIPVVREPAVAAATTEPVAAFKSPPVQPAIAIEVPTAMAQDARTPPAISTNRILAWVVIILFINAAILGWFILRKKTKGTIAGKAVPTLISDTLYDRLADSVRAAAMDSSIVYAEVPDEPDVTGNPGLNAMSPGSRYYIVAGCFRDEINADSLVSSLKLLGYKAEKFGKIGNLFAVCFASFDDKDKAVSELKNIREKVPSAWMTKF